jgi:hypothetical protein
MKNVGQTCGLSSRSSLLTLMLNPPLKQVLAPMKGLERFSAALVHVAS